MRAFFSERMREGATNFTQLHSEYAEVRRIGGERLAALTRKGAAATASAHAGCRRPFGSVGNKRPCDVDQHSFERSLRTAAGLQAPCGSHQGSFGALR
jgi:hypothetical protein